MSKIFLILLMSCGLMISVGATDRYVFSSNAESLQFSRLTQQMRCLVCQNETIADSEAPLAQDLRQQIYSKVRDGESDQTIIDYMIARYGRFILFKPPFEKSTWFLWFAPLGLLVMGFLLLSRHLLWKR